jgi:hypothetical protein
MRWHFFVGLLSVLGGAVLLLGQPALADTICPIYPYAQFATYWSYYSEDCTTQTWCSFDGPPNLPQGLCSSDLTNCFPVDSFRKTPKGGIERLPRVHGDTKKGLKTLQGYANTNPKPLPGVTVLRKYKVAIETTPDGKYKSKAVLFVILVNPKQFTTPQNEPPAFYGNGQEVNKDDAVQTVDFDLKHDRVISVAGKAAIVQLGDIPFQVIFHEGTPLVERPAGKAKAKAKTQ